MIGILIHIFLNSKSGESQNVIEVEYLVYLVIFQI